MRHRMGLLVLTAVLASACQFGGVGTVAARKAATARPAAAGPSPAAPEPAGVAPAGLRPSATASTMPSFAKLQRPRGDQTVVLAGTVTIDAAYAVSAGGNLISNNSGSSIAAGGAHVLANNGATMTEGNGQSTIISEHGGGVIASGDGNVIANNSATVVSDHGTGIISEHGAGIVSQNGAGANGSTGHSLRQLQAAAASPNAASGAAGATMAAAVSGAATATGQLAVGTELPAVGMLVQVVSLEDGSPVSLGLDSGGQAAYGVYTNATGRYEVYVPRTLQHNVVVRAVVPENHDPRLSYALIADPTGASTSAIDEDSSLVYQFVQQSFEGKLRELVSRPNFADPTVLTQIFPVIASNPIYATLLTTAVNHFQDQLTQNHVPDARRGDVAAAAADAILAYTKLDDVPLAPVGTAYAGPKDEKAIAAMTGVLRKVREGAQHQMAAHGTDFFATQPYMQEANRVQASGMPAIEVRKPSDIAGFCVSHYLTSNDETVYYKLNDVFTSVGVSTDEVQHLFAANSGLVLALGLTFAQDEDASAAVDRAIKRVSAGP